MYSPTLEPGEICTSPGECIGFPDAGCIPAGPEGPLVCHVPEAPVRAGSGEPCGGECDGVLCGQSFFARPGLCHSEDGLYCSFATGVCEERVALGDSCLAYSSACGPDAHCDSSCPFPDPSSLGSDPCYGICKTLPAAGEQCADGYRCTADSSCASICEPECVGICACPGVCVEAAGEGEPCTSDSGLLLPCSAGLVCVYRPDGSSCERAAIEGAPCDVDLFAQCVGFTSLFCDPETQTCDRPRADGHRCADDYQCDSSYCADGRCSPRKPVGEPCSRDQECLTFDCSSDVPSPVPTPLADTVSQSGEGVCQRSFYPSPYECGVPPTPSPIAPMATPPASVPLQMS